MPSAVDHDRILDAGAHDHADARAVEHDVEHQQRHRDDAEHRQPVGRIEHEAELGDAGEQRRRLHRLRQAAEEETHELDEDDAETEGDQELVLVRPLVEMADDAAFHHHADQHDEQRAGDDRDDERAGIAIGDPAGVAAEHEHGAMREVEHAERAVDDRQAGRDQRQQRAEHQSVERLRDEICPIDHESPGFLFNRLRKHAYQEQWPRHQTQRKRCRVFLPGHARNGGLLRP